MFKTVTKINNLKTELIDAFKSYEKSFNTYNKNVEKAMLEHPLSKFKMQDALAFVA